MKVNNGDYRNKRITITLKDSEGNTLQGYPCNQDITNAFEYDGKNYDALSDNEFAELSDAAYQTRLQDFLAYLEETFEGLDTDGYVYEPGEEPYGTDTVLCPIGE